MVENWPFFDKFALFLKSESKKDPCSKIWPLVKRSTFFVLSSWNLVKMISSWVDYFQPVDFLQMANLSMCLIFFDPDFRCIHVIFSACNVYIFYSLSLSASSTTKMAPGGGHPRPIKRSYCVPCTIARVNHKTEKSGRKGEKTLHITINQTLDMFFNPFCEKKLFEIH